MQILSPPIDQLVREIKAVNQQWKHARELFGDESPIATSSRELKGYLQAYLLRKFAPENLYLKRDNNSEGEELYSLQLRNSISGYWDAEHLPVRVAHRIFTNQELEKFYIN
jgi:hypothetical protein